MAATTTPTAELARQQAEDFAEYHAWRVEDEQVAEIDRATWADDMADLVTRSYQ